MDCPKHLRKSSSRVSEASGTDTVENEEDIDEADDEDTAE